MLEAHLKGKIPNHPQNEAVQRRNRSKVLRIQQTTQHEDELFRLPAPVDSEALADLLRLLGRILLARRRLPEPFENLGVDFLRGGTRKGQGQNLLRLDSVNQHQPHVPRRERKGLSRPG